MSWIITGTEKNDPVGIENVSLLLHGDGANGSTTIIDSSPSPKTVTAVGNAQISTAQSKFGGSSISLPSSGSNLTIPYNAALRPGQQWTYECWFWLNSTSDPQYGQSFLWNLAGAGNFDIRKSGNVLYFYCFNGSSQLITTIKSSYTFVAQRWDHLAVVKDRNNYSFYFNGNRTASVTNANPVFNSTFDLVIGSEVSGFSQFTGYLDEVRITTVARYSGASFTLPTAPFPDS